MIESIDDLLKAYELGKLTRRKLLAAIALLLTSCQRAPEAQDSLFKARSFNHLNIRVTDVAKSESFYRKVLGMTPARPVVGTAFALDFPAGGFLSLCSISVETCGVKANPQPGTSTTLAWVSTTLTQAASRRS